MDPGAFARASRKEVLSFLRVATLVKHSCQEKALAENKLHPHRGKLNQEMSRMREHSLSSWIQPSLKLVT